MLKRDHSSGATAVKVLKSGPVQKFSPHFLEGAAGEGWLTRDGVRITLRTVAGPLTYLIVREPGYYCSTCLAADLASVVSPFGSTDEARAHVKDEHPDSFLSYQKDNFFFTVKE